MVGMFRSNTRDADAVADEDRTLFQEYFPPPSGVFLLIRPFASKTSTAAFLVYRDGELQDSSTDVFPFLRRELEGGPAPVRRPLESAGGVRLIVTARVPAELRERPKASRPPPPPRPRLPR